MVLINADSFKKFIESLPRNPNGTSRVYSESDILHFIDAQPTAYNTEAVVAEIKKKHCQKCRNILGVVGAEEYCKEQKCEINELCDIVKRGGVE